MDRLQERIEKRSFQVQKCTGNDLSFVISTQISKHRSVICADLQKDRLLARQKAGKSFDLAFQNALRQSAFCKDPLLLLGHPQKLLKLLAKQLRQSPWTIEGAPSVFKAEGRLVRAMLQIAKGEGKQFPLLLFQAIGVDTHEMGEKKRGFVFKGA